MTKNKRWKDTSTVFQAVKRQCNAYDPELPDNFEINGNKPTDSYARE